MSLILPFPSHLVPNLPIGYIHFHRLDQCTQTWLLDAHIVWAVDIFLSNIYRKVNYIYF